MLLAISVVLMLVLLAIGTHVSVVLGLVSIGMVLMLDGVPTTVIAQTAFKAVNSYPLVAIPMFLLAGNLMMRGNVADQMIDLVGSVVRAIKGGLALTVMISSVFFAAVAGSSVGAAAAIASSTVEGLKRENYPPHFSAGVVAVGGTLGLMLPPSLGFILIGSIVGLPVDKLFIAGVVPGIMEAILLTIAVMFIARRKGYGISGKAANWVGFSRKLPTSIPVLLMPVLILGSIYTGLLTPTEVAAYAAFYAMLLVLLFYRSVPLAGIWGTCKESLLQTSMIFAVVMGGSLIGFVLARMGISAQLVGVLSGMSVSPWEFLLIANIILLVLGMFLDGVAMIVLTAPILFPAAMAVGINPIHFAVVMVANVEIATLTPPVGLNLFVVGGITKLPVHEVGRGVMPFYAVRLLGLALITYVPALSLVLL